jgi:hypothetical protein
LIGKRLLGTGLAIAVIRDRVASMSQAMAGRAAPRTAANRGR